MTRELSSERLLKLVELAGRQFNLGTITACSQISNDPLSKVYKLETEAGSVCLKRHRHDKTYVSLDLEEQLILRLGESGFPLSPHLVPTSGGQHHIEVDGDCWSLYEFVPAQAAFDWKVPTWNGGHCFQAGAALAVFHLYGRACMPLFETREKAIPPVYTSMPDYLKYGLSAAASAAPALPADPLLAPDRLLSGALANRDEVGSLCQSEMLEHLVAHGDFHPGNLLFQADKPVCLLDYDEAHLDSPAFDLAYALVSYSMRWTGHDQPAPSESTDGSPDGSLDEKLLQAFLDGYRRQCLQHEWQPALLEKLDSPYRALTMLKPHMKLVCYLSIGWVMNRFAHEPQELHLLLTRTLLHFARGLNTLQL